MTRGEVINDIFGNEWDCLDSKEQSAACRVIQWMTKNFGVTNDIPSRDDGIMSAIQVACIQVFNQTYEDIMSKKRNRERVDRRCMIYKVARELSKSSDNGLAKHFPKDRVTMFYHGVKQANTLLSVDKDFRSDYVKFETAVKDIFQKNYEQSNNGN